MKLIGINKLYDGRYLKGYDLQYENRTGREKHYEIVSRHDICSADELGTTNSGVSVIAFCGEKLLLLKEFRMGVNQYIYNLCAGMIEDGETIEDCIARELNEETGLQLDEIITILPPSFAAPAISDVVTQIAVVRVSGAISDSNLSANEQIKAALYSKEETAELLKNHSFSSRAQLAAYCFTQGLWTE